MHHPLLYDKSKALATLISKYNNGKKMTRELYGNNTAKNTFVKKILKICIQKKYEMCIYKFNTAYL